MISVDVGHVENAVFDLKERLSEFAAAAASGEDEDEQFAFIAAVLLTMLLHLIMLYPNARYENLDLFYKQLKDSLEDASRIVALH